ncbi:MAG: thioredoxin domain-containing protein [Candidatus Heimdallarchaeota archaeon]|nr:thioredoxin domain-containing protein [Candidatus Heimdallarchaeota archaeon]
MNLLYKETSPYLQQHKDNPIHWFPYGDEAFDKAKLEDKPIFISIGYSSCHWCHVMARESFSDEKTALYLNEHFICIKIDREEHPAVDKAYQEMYQLLNKRGGGWPLSTFTLPDGSPFVLATYIPNESKYGMKSFLEICEQVVEIWGSQRELAEQQADAIQNGLQQYNEYLLTDEDNVDLSEDIYSTEVTKLLQRGDRKYGGFGGAPKFPRVSSLRFLLREGYRSQDQDALEFTRFSFHKMALGGIYDQLGGGFARYSVDIKWLVPHFEKMLYDNAGLLLLGSELHKALNDKFSEWVVYDTMLWVSREMRSKYGAFYSTLNAESEGREGKFYVWTRQELKSILEDDFQLAEYRYGITEQGNFKDPHHPEINGMNILSVVRSIKEVSENFSKSEEEIIKKLSDIRQTLFAERAKRIPPSRDTKIITSWNSLMIIALLEVAETFDLQEAETLAINALDFLEETMIKEDKILHSYHTVEEDQVWREIDGYLDDYSFTIAAMIKAFETFDDWKYIKLAAKLEKIVTSKFYSDKDKVYFLKDIHSHRFNRIMQTADESMISGFAVMVQNLFKLGHYLEDKHLVKRGEQIANKFAKEFSGFPGAMNGFMISSSDYLRFPTEIVLINCEDSELDHIHRKLFIPSKLIYRYNNKNKDDGRPFWENVKARGFVEQATAFICQGMTCSLPIINPKDLEEVLHGGIEPT